MLKKMMGLWSLEVDTFGYLVEYLKERNGWIFGGKAKSIQDFKLYFLRTLYGRSQVLDHGTNLTFLDFVDRIVVESLRA